MNRRTGRKILLILMGCCLFILLFLLTLVLLLPLSETGTPPSTTVSTVPTDPPLPTQIPAGTTAAPVAPPWNFAVISNGQGQLRFQVTATDLINHYSYHYSPGMRPLEQWRKYPDSTVPCTQIACTRYEYQADPAIHTFPVVAVYTDPRTQQLLAVSLPLSQHDWSENLQTIYRHQTLRILALFLPGLDSTQHEALFTDLFQDAHENEYISHGDMPAPKTLRVAGSIGCYAYIYRGMICINIIPVDRDTLSDFSARGIIIAEI